MSSRPTLLQQLYIVLAALLFVLGLLGVFLPLLPTTPFMLAAIALASRGSPRFAAWIRAHRYAGPAIRDWERERAISRRSKTVAVAMLLISALVVWWHIDYRPLAVGVTAGLCLVALFLTTRPTPGPTQNLKRKHD